jgi:hypothetical protein
MQSYPESVKRAMAHNYLTLLYSAHIPAEQASLMVEEQYGVSISSASVRQKYYRLRQKGHPTLSLTFLVSEAAKLNGITETEEV